MSIRSAQTNKLKNKGKVQYVAWDDQSDDEGIGSDSSKSEFENSKLIEFMAKSNSPSLQGSSNKDSNDDIVDSHRFGELSDDGQDWEEAYKSLCKDCIKMSKLNEKMTLKWKSAEDQIALLKSELEDAHGKVTQLETKHNLLLKNLIDADVKSSQLLEDAKRSANETESLKMELHICQE